MSALTNLLAKRIPQDRAFPYSWVLFLLGLIAYTIPWLTNSGASLSPNAYDLAEWASLPPAERAMNPALVTSFFLRLPLICLTLMVVVQMPLSNRRWLGLSVTGAVALAALPPLEFFTQANGDPNFRQQFALSLLTLIGGLIGATNPTVRRFQRLIILTFAFAGAMACMTGLVQGESLIRQFGLQAQAGLGGIMMTFIFLALAIAGLHRGGARTA